MSAPPPSAPPGWYPDPTDPGHRRYWTGQEWAAAEPPAKTRHPAWPWIGALALVAAVGVVLAIVSNSGNATNDSPGRDGGGSSLHTVIYKLDGTASGADITIATPNGTTQQQDVEVPLINRSGDAGLRFQMAGGAFMYISAQNSGDGELTCTIEEDGVVVSTNTATGEFAIATCEGRA